MRKSKIILAILAAAMALTATIGSTMAYFTTYVTAQGGMTIGLGSSTIIAEPDISSWTKHVVIYNEGPNACYVRARAYASNTYELTYSDVNGKWTPGGDGYYYYNELLPGGRTTEELLVKINNIPTDVNDGYSFNVVVIYESTPVLYDADGNPYPDWTQAVEISGEAEGGRRRV